MPTPQEIDGKARPFVVFVILSVTVMVLVALLLCAVQYNRYNNRRVQAVAVTNDVAQQVTVKENRSSKTNEIETVTFTIRPRLASGPVTNSNPSSVSVNDKKQQIR